MPGDRNKRSDVFVHDRQTRLTTRVSVDSQGEGGNGGSFFPSVSGNGGSVAFHSFAANLVPGDTNLRGDVFVHDRGTAQTNRVSVDSQGRQAAGPRRFGRISDDGQLVAFDSLAKNAVPGDTNNARDVFVHDRGDPQDVAAYRLQVALGDFGTIVLDVLVTAASAVLTQFQATGDLADGTYLWRVTARDRALNEAVPDIRSFTIDTVPPAPPVPVAPIGFIKDDTPLFEWTASISDDVVSNRLQVTSGGNIAVGPYNINVLLSGDTTQFRVDTADALADDEYRCAW